MGWGESDGLDISDVSGDKSGYKPCAVGLCGLRSNNVMAKRESEKEDNQRGKGSKSSDQAIADDADASSSQAPSRVHIFKDKGKSSQARPSKSGDEPLQCSSFGASRLIGLDSARGVGHGRTAILPGVKLAIIELQEELMQLGCKIQKGKEALYEAAMRAEDLEAVIEG